MSVNELQSIFSISPWPARDDLRRRFVKAESELFRYRYGTDLTDDRDNFLKSQDFGWSTV